MAHNLPTFYQNQAVVRAGEVPRADWLGGANLGGSNAIGIGISTSVINPPAQDWARLADLDGTGRFSEHLGQIGSPIGVLDFDGETIDRRVAFVQADAQTAPNAVLDSATGARNRSGETVPAGTWIWGVIVPAEPEV